MGWAPPSLARPGRARPPRPTAEAGAARRPSRRETGGRCAGRGAAGAGQKALHPGLSPGSTSRLESLGFQTRRRPPGAAGAAGARLRSWGSGLEGGRPQTEGARPVPAETVPSRRRGAPRPGFCDPRRARPGWSEARRSLDPVHRRSPKSPVLRAQPAASPGAREKRPPPSPIRDISVAGGEPRWEGHPQTLRRAASQDLGPRSAGAAPHSPGAASLWVCTREGLMGTAPGAQWVHRTADLWEVT